MSFWSPRPLALAGLLAGCGLFTEPDQDVVPARIIREERAAPITLPGTVSRGAQFSVTVTTLEGGCVRRAARTDVTTSGLLAEITPYNVRYVSVICTSDPVAIPHTARIRFTEPGTATVRIRGVRDLSGFERQEPIEWVTLERQVVVQ